MDCVFRRGKVYCAVISVPIDLHDLVGKKQIWRSLKTKTYSVARSQARKLPPRVRIVVASLPKFCVNLGASDKGAL